MKRLLLVDTTAPYTIDQIYSAGILEQVRAFLPKSRLKSHLEHKKAINLPPLALMILSAITKKHYKDEFEIQLHDEKIMGLINPNKFDCNDLVVFSANTTMAPRIYGLASKFRENGSKVALGGIHPTVKPNEAQKYADSIVVGEAEYVLPELLNDFLHGKLKQRYQANRFLDMKRDYVWPDKSITKPEHYFFDTSIETARGCPSRCKFCSGPIISGKKYRMRDLKDVIDQIEQTESDYIFFPSDNLTGDPIFAKELLTELIKLNKRWAGSTSLSLSEDPELTDLMIESGCKFLVVGFESTSEKFLKRYGKKHNIGKDYGKFVRDLQNNGVLVAASFILGSDRENEESIQTLYDYVINEKFMFYIPGVETPYPGTALYDEYKEAKRLLYTKYPEDWIKYNVKRGIPVFSDKHGQPYSPKYLKCLEDAVTNNGMNYFLKQATAQPEYFREFIEKFAS
ncbi:B12-binding domain-containing radical SAM protein [Nanoarchaeota archaeon]